MAREPEYSGAVEMSRERRMPTYDFLWGLREMTA